MKIILESLEGLVILFFLSTYACREILLNSDGGDIPYDDCGGLDGNQVAVVKLTGCETDEICEIIMGKSLTLTINWKTIQNGIKALRSSLVLSLCNGFSMNVAIKPDNACDYLKCPIAKNSEIAYTGTFTVPEKFLPGSGRIMWHGFEKSETDSLLCVDFRVNILAPTEK
ncbi:hypothetical protein WA026_005176 [Henosepilachna vigintioctopunctata]|uniref:MD-2-related lipid-recognition domain-containing protein n=1 Tax=Henosepilachna vigintioctopunctata TaxID=420089 RepID=A0AAW1UUU7_9CUCU